LIQAKASGLEDRSDSILVSFDSKWEDLLLNNHIFTVFRKKVPKTFDPAWLYIYINIPEAKIVGRAKIKKIETVNLSKAISLSKSACLDINELKSYMDNSDKVGAYFLKTVQTAPLFVNLQTVKKHLKFYPPQSFLILSKEAKMIIDKLCLIAKEEK